MESKGMKPFYMEWLPASSIKDWPQIHSDDAKGKYPPLLLAIPSREVATIGLYLPERERFRVNDSLFDVHPTHFMPLPPLPNAKK